MEYEQWPEVHISEILKSHGIEPCEQVYDILDGKTFFLIRNGTLVNYETRNMGSVQTENSEIMFKAIIVDENGKKKGAGIYFESVKGGEEKGILKSGSDYWDKPGKDTGIIGFLTKLKKNSAEGGI